MTEPTPTWDETAEEVMAEKHSLLQRLGRADTTELFPDARDAQVTRLTARVAELEAALRGTMTTPTEQVIALKNAHCDTWRDMPEFYWFARLTEEIGELGGSLVGNHEGPIDHELTQIAAICLNWLEMREGKP